MRARCTQRPELKWCATQIWLVLSSVREIADIAAMPHVATGSIDVVIDKGTTDAYVLSSRTLVLPCLTGTCCSIMCSDSFTRLMPRVIKEAHRVLAPGGRWIMISFADDRKQCAVSTNKLALTLESLTHHARTRTRTCTHVL